MSGFRPRFFAPSGVEPGPGVVITLDAEDSHHALRVLRLRPGDECEAVVGAAVYAATMLPGAAGGADKAVQVRLESRLEGPEAGAGYSREIALVQALARPSALDWAIEKATEVGATLIVLVPAAGSPRPAGKDTASKLARWARIAREAAKQSKQPAVPAVALTRSLAEALALVRGRGLGSVVLDPRAGRTLQDLVVSRARADGSACGGGTAAASGDSAEPGLAVWVGPESGWTADELLELVEAGVSRARLGRGVLRTETAGPVAVAVARLTLGDW